MQDTAAKLNIKRAEKIFTVSEFSKKEIVKHYGLAGEKIVCVPMGYSRNNQYSILNNQYLKNKSIIYIGRIEKKKSVDILVEAFNEFSYSYPDWKLVLAGRDGYGAEEIKHLVVDIKLSE